MIKNVDVSTHDLQTFNLVSTLISIINKNSDTDMDFILADYFLKHLEDLESISIYEIADACITLVLLSNVLSKILVLNLTTSLKVKHRKHYDTIDAI